MGITLENKLDEEELYPPLSPQQVEINQLKYGKNIVNTVKVLRWYIALWHSVLHPFNAILACLAIVAGATQDFRTMAVMLAMVVLSVLIRFVQEFKSEKKAAFLKSLVENKVTVIRKYCAPGDRDPTWEDVERMDQPEEQEISFEDVVPGDIIKLSAGTLIPGDVLILSSKDLFVSQAALTGESMPVEKFAPGEKSIEKINIDGLASQDVALFQQRRKEMKKIKRERRKRKRATTCRNFFLKLAKKKIVSIEENGSALSLSNVREVASVSSLGDLDRPDICFMGTSVVSGTATVVVLKIGPYTALGQMAIALSQSRPKTAFQKGVTDVSYMFIGIMAVMLPLVLVISGIVQKDWLQAFLFAISVAVGLTPEMLPMIVNTNLARGSMVMAKKKTIVKKIESIINFGAIDVLCTDKTGTLTQNKVVLLNYLNYDGQVAELPLEYAYLNSFFQTSLKNLLDVAVIEYYQKHGTRGRELTDNYCKVDEIPFDFVRRRMSVVLKSKWDDQHVLVSKGAVDEMLHDCSHLEVNGQRVQFEADMAVKARKMGDSLNMDGLRVIAVGYKSLNDFKMPFAVKDEEGLTFLGFIAFLDPPKESTAPAIRELMQRGVEIKVLTGDSPLVCKKVCEQVNLPIKSIVTTNDIKGLSEQKLADIAESGTIFARLTPIEKSNIVKALRTRGHTVGFLGDGINDAVALKSADVGISVDDGVDVAKESADIILLEKSLMVLVKGVIVGRITFCNTVKYIKMAISSNFGNVFSILVASAWIPFLPLLPIHIVVQNLLYDISQIAIPWDNADDDYIQLPRTWKSKDILKFMLFMGPISSIFDILTFIYMRYYFGIQTADDNTTLFQTAWFVEGLLTQTLIIHIVRTDKWPLIQSRPSWQVAMGTLLVMALGISLPFIPVVNSYLRMEPLPALYFPFLFGVLISYCLLAQSMKLVYIRIFGSWM
jgi:Mg2+-importing ATPase